MSQDRKVGYSVRKVRYSTMEDTFARVGDLKVRIRRRKASGTPILFIHGLGGCIEGWEPVVKRLDGYDLIGLDHPGTGLSSPPNRVLTKPELAQFYVQALDLLDVERAHVLGFSFGGTIAQQLAHDHPDRVTSLILCSTAPGQGGVPPDPVTMAATANPMRHQILFVREALAPVIYRGRAGRNPRLFEDELSGWEAHRATLLGVGAQLGSDAGWSSLPWLSKLDLPVLVLCGDDDPMTKVENSRMIAEAIPGAELHVYEDGGHLLIFDEPDEPLRQIRAFLERVSADARV